jgi:hypothetical protein
MLYVFKKFIFIVILISSAIILLVSHVEDGNIWGIYIENGLLFIGDFWSTVFVVALFIEAYIQSKAIISYVLGLSEGEK